MKDLPLVSWISVDQDLYFGRDISIYPCCFSGLDESDVLN